MILAVLWVAAPHFEVSGLTPDVATAAARQYESLVTTMEQASGKPLVRTDRTIVIEEAHDMRAFDAGVSSLGRVRLRKGATALAHELAHQVLLLHCPQASADKLFHEAFAISTSGELDAWIADRYFSSVKAEKVLRSSPSLDTRDARQALARLIADGRGSGAVPVAVARRLSACSSGVPWTPMHIEELSTPAARAGGDAFIAVSRHTGEVLQTSGDTSLAMPFGSVLKPFVVAGASAEAPVLKVDARDPLWRCGETLPAEMNVAAALQRSCNAYFLQWGRRSPELAQFGAYGALFLALGLERLPEQMDEAIGLRPTLSLSAFQVAQAYRVLAAARPDIVAMLSHTADLGTLAGLSASRVLQAYALKTGTVRDPQNNVDLGWIVAIAPDWIAVMVQKGAMPRAFADRFAQLVNALEKLPLLAKARVQVFGLLDLSDVEADCPGVPVSLGAQPVVGKRGYASLARMQGEMLCLGQPFRIRFPGVTGRLYAGSFSKSRAPALVAGEPRARRGSDVIFSTTRQRYASGVLQSEDAALTGEPRRALAKVILHNAEVDRHAGRPVCDTTHCQAFQGTPADFAPLRALDALAPWLDTLGWLPFSRGGAEPWTADVPLASVSATLGAVPQSFTFAKASVTFAAWVDEVERTQTLGCERLRGPLKLPSCPDRARIDGDIVHFWGVGRGHGLGLDVEAAKVSTQDAATLLDRAYR